MRASESRSEPRGIVAQFARAAVLRVALPCALFFAAGCSHRSYTVQPPTSTPAPRPTAASTPPPTIAPQPVAPGAYVEQGIASWYGVPFNGHRTSDGEIYDMHGATAAHRTLPFGAVVRVTNLQNGKQTEVRINDRGPFVANRIIDLSYAAAQSLGMIGPGTARVRIEVVSGPNPQTGFFGVQVGAFREQENAERLKAQLEGRYSPVTIATYDSPAGLFYRVRVGRLSTEAAAQQLAGDLQAGGESATFVVRLD